MTERNSEITDFIARRFKKDCNWMDGNCYYFATILIARFPDLQMMYLPILGHFMAYDPVEDTYYDFRGMHSAAQILAEDRPMLFDEIAKVDPPYYEALVRDCVK